MSSIDPTIPLQIKPLNIESPLQTMQRVLTMRDMLSREKLTQQEIATGQENARRLNVDTQLAERKLAGDHAVKAAVQKYTTLDLSRDPDSGDIGTGV